MQDLPSERPLGEKIVFSVIFIASMLVVYYLAHQLAYEWLPSQLAAALGFLIFVTSGLYLLADHLKAAADRHRDLKRHDAAAATGRQRSRNSRLDTL